MTFEEGEAVFVSPGERERLVVRFGPEVLSWCEELPALVKALTDRWGLEVIGSGGGGTSRVFRCMRRDGRAPVWLKLTPDPVIAGEEAEALQAWAGRPSVVRLQAQDVDSGALLLQDVAPGVPARRLAWRPSQAAALLRDLRHPPLPVRPRSVLRPLSDRVGFLFELTARRLHALGMDDLLPPPAVERARKSALRLAGSGPVSLVHGDLHTANVLSGPASRLVAIDPRPAWGDPDFDAVDWVLEGAVCLEELQRRIEELAALVPGLSRDRLLAWCRALAVLLAVPALHTRRDDPHIRFLLGL
ncbi:aminoglycoside phosphotransferase family protein [Actinocorallia sp. B10E7]|uniref:aminoglycoside phosphotransferase family protein n=1 Tax=Actinocorallia sp. B10E7 TaxID=3153558 RepID=UPI00325DD716